MRTAERLAEVLAEFDRIVGLERLGSLHVNDSVTPIGSNRDRHANVLEGVLGEQLGVFVSHPLLQELPAVMETPGPDDHGPDAAEMRKLRDLHARWTSEPPARRSRTRSARRP